MRFLFVASTLIILFFGIVVIGQDNTCFPLAVDGTETCLCPVGEYYANNVCNSFQPTASNGSETDMLVNSYFNPNYDVSNFEVPPNFENNFFVVTICLLLAWLTATCFLRCLPVGDGNAPGGGLVFRIRRAVTRVDRRYHRKHWLDEQKVLIKRRTELGGICSGMSYIFTVGTMLGLGFQQFLGRASLDQNIIVNNGREAQNFANYFLWNVTVISGMDCSQYELTGSYMNSQDNQRPFYPAEGYPIRCEDTPLGPAVVLECPSCYATSDLYTISFKFIDQPGKPALASGFNFQFISRETNNSISRESGTTGSLKPGGTLRGPVSNVLVFKAVPRIITDAGNLKLFQATFNELLVGSQLRSQEELAASVQNSSASLDVVLQVEFLTDYIVVTDNNPLTLNDIFTWLAAMGGLYQVGLSLFYLLQLQVEIRARSLAYDEDVLAIAHRVFHRQKLWRKAKYAMKSYFLLCHWKDIKARYKDETIVLLLEMDGQQKKEEREGEVANGGGPEEATVVTQNVASGLRHRLSRTASARKRQGEKNLHDLRSDLADIDDLDVENSAAELPGEPSEPSSKPIPTQIVTMPESEEGPSSMATLPFHKLRAPISVSEKIQRAASALRPSATLSKPAFPHVQLWSGQFPGPRSRLTKSEGHEKSSDSISTLEPQSAVTRVRKKSTAYLHYGSNTAYKGTVVRDLRKPSWLLSEDYLPAVPCMEEEVDSDEEIEWSHLIGHAKELYAYNVRLRQDFLAFQTMIENTVQYFRPHSDL